MKKMKLKKWQIIVLAVVVIGGGYFWYQKAHSGNTQIQYVTAPAEKGTLTTSVSASGNMIVNSSVNIDPTITGTVSNLAVNVGDQVKKGQLLFTIVNDQLQVTADQSQASYAQSDSSLQSAEASLKSAEASQEADKNAPASAKQKRMNLATDADKIEAAEQAVTAAQQSLSASGTSLSYEQQQAGQRQVFSPIDGTVNAINVKNGDDLASLSSGSSRVVPMVIGDLTTLEAQVQVNEVDVPNVQIGQKVMMTFDAIPGLNVSGKIDQLDTLGTVTSGVVTYNANITLDTLDPRIKSGMSVSANIITGVEQDVITVPNSAIKTKGGTTYVQVLNSGQTVPSQVSVQIGVANNTDTEITSGINVGDNVVTRTINPNATAAAATTTASSAATGGAARAGGGIGGGGGAGGGGIRL